MAVVPHQVSVDAAIVSVLSELENISSLKEEQKAALFFMGNFFFSLS